MYKMKLRERERRRRVAREHQVLKQYITFKNLFKAPHPTIHI